MTLPVPSRRRSWMFALRRYITFFLLMSFIITCCMLLFLKSMVSVSGIPLTGAHIRTAAKLTFGNVILLSLLCTLIDGIRRKIMVDRPVRRIARAAEQIVQGDFSARVQPVHQTDSLDGFDAIITCFNAMARELSGIETLRTDFISNVSHELKTPLAAIQNYAVLLQQPGLTESQRREYAAAVAAAARRLSSLISNILKLNRLENQQIYPDQQTFDLGEQLRLCLLDFETAWEQKRLTLEADIPDGIFVRSDPELLALVWNNLISNAVKFTPSGGRILVRVRADGPMATVRVSDSGCGFPEEVGRHIFEKFYQGDTSHAAEGNGLGLALVKRVMDITGSGITVESAVGRGSTFTVTLEAAEWAPGCGGC